MEKETKLTLLCRINQEAEDDFKILINDEEISEKSIINNYSYSLIYSCAPGEYNLKIIQNNFVLSRWWWLLLSFIYGFLSIISYSVDAYAGGIGPFYAVAEGKLAVTGDASVEIKLL